MGGRGSSSKINRQNRGTSSSATGANEAKTPKKEVSTNAEELKGKAEKEFTEKTATQYKKTITKAEADALREYQGAAYRTINKGLRTGTKLDKDDKQTIKHLDKAMSKNKLSQNMVLYRGLKQNEVDKLMKTKVGSKITDKGYSSTSTKKEIASAFARGEYPGTIKNVIAKYSVAKGTPAIHVPSTNKAVGRTSMKDAEKEVLLNRNTTATFKGFSKRGRNVIANFVIS